MRITLDRAANRDLDAIFEWMSAGSPRAASEIIGRIEARIALLGTPGLENMGRPGLDPGTRELVEYPYIIVYEVFESRNEIVVWSIVHGARKRKKE
jgi:plasmid stabilization system protein ParE